LNSTVQVRPQMTSNLGSIEVLLAKFV
jgi:hypothetical protein